MSQTIIDPTTIQVELHTRGRGGLTVTQRKIINALIHVVQKTTEKQNEYKVPTSAIQEICKISKNNNSELRQIFSALQDVRLVFNYLNKSKEVWDSNVLLPRVLIERNSEFITFEFTSFICQQLLKPTNPPYVKLDILLISEFNNSYTIAVYELLKDYYDAHNIPLLSIEKFRNLVGVKSYQYKDFPNLRLHVIDMAKNEINEKSDLSCGYDLKKGNGNQYVSIQWWASKKDNLAPKVEAPFVFPTYILTVLPGKYQNLMFYKIMQPYLSRLDAEVYIVSNIKHSLNNAKLSLSGYLEKSLAEDWAKETRESNLIEARTESMFLDDEPDFDGSSPDNEELTPPDDQMYGKW